jgi:E3 Ubiquitin ligase
MAMIAILMYVANQQHGTSIHVEGSAHFPPLPFLILGVGLFAYGFVLYRRYQRLQDTPRTTARAVAMGFAHVRGKTVAAETLQSPMTKVPCCYYSYAIEHWEDRRNRWAVISRDMRSCPFYIDDGTGRVLVNPAGAKFDLPRMFAAVIGAKQTGTVQSNPTPEIFIDTSLGVAPPSTSDLLGMKTAAVSKQFTIKRVDGTPSQEILNKAYPDDARYRFTETCLPIGREVAVFGTCTQNPNSSDVSMIVKGQTDKILMITSNPEAKAESNLRSTAIRFAVIGAVCLFITFATCQPVMRTVPGSGVHSSK